MADNDLEPWIVNVDDSDWSGTDGDGSPWKHLGRLAGGSRLGCTLEEVKPGGRPASYHYHLANEEPMYMVEGHGTLRTPEGEQPIESGDSVAFPRANRGRTPSGTRRTRRSGVFSSPQCASPMWSPIWTRERST